MIIVNLGFSTCKRKHPGCDGNCDRQWLGLGRRRLNMAFLRCQVSSSEEGCRKDNPSPYQKWSLLAGMSSMQGFGAVYNLSCPSLSRPLSALCHEEGQRMRDPLMTEVGAAGVIGKELDLAWGTQGQGGTVLAPGRTCS